MIEEIKKNFNNNIMVELICKEPNRFIGFCVCDNPNHCSCNHSYNKKVLDKDRLIIANIDNSKLFFSDGLFININELKYFTPVYKEISPDEILGCALMLLVNGSIVKCDEELSSNSLDRYCFYKVNNYEEFVIEYLEKIDIYKSPI